MSKSNLPTNTPSEVVNISPEALEVANTYLQDPDINKVAQLLEISVELVTQILAKREVKAYVDQVFYNLGFNNRFKLRSAMDALISKKFKEMDEADIGSSKDILELLSLSHKMSMEHMDKEIKLEALRASNVKNQTNIQINEGIGGSKYSNLMEKLMQTGAVIDV